MSIRRPQSSSLLARVAAASSRWASARLRRYASLGVRADRIGIDGELESPGSAFGSVVGGVERDAGSVANNLVTKTEGPQDGGMPLDAHEATQEAIGFLAVLIVVTLFVKAPTMGIDVKGGVVTDAAEGTAPPVFPVIEPDLDERHWLSR